MDADIKVTLSSPLLSSHTHPCPRPHPRHQKITAYLKDPAWLSWLALVNVETAAVAHSFTTGPHGSIVALDDLQLKHHTLFQKVKEYKNADKPKLMWRANYPCDILLTGPLIRTHCMTFEAMLQVLKKIAANSNYKNIVKRSEFCQRSHHCHPPSPVLSPSRHQPLNPQTLILLQWPIFGEFVRLYNFTTRNFLIGMRRRYL